MNKLIMIEQHLTCGHVIATLEIRGKVRALTIVTQNFDEAELHELLECDNVTDVDFVEGESIDFYFKQTPDSPSKYIKFERKYF